MAVDADSPSGELSESNAETKPETEPTALEETSTAAEPESSAVEVSDSGEPAEATTETETDEAEDADEVEEAKPARKPLSHLTLALIVGLVAVLGLAGLTGWLGFNAYQAYQAKERHNLFLQVGRQGALNLTTIDFQHADADVQRILDSATGTFYDDFDKRAQPFIEVVKQAQSKSVGAVTEAGIEEESDHDAKVLVAVTVNTTNAGAPEQAPRLWRMRLTVQQAGSDAKVSNVEFVP